MDTKQNLWIEKKKKIILLIAAVMAVVLVVSFISFFKIEEEKQEEEFKPYDSMYNASRYFFRVFYPDDWDVNADPYGFILDENGLVLELFPLKKIVATPLPEGATPTIKPTPTPIVGSASATVDPRAGMERNNDLTIKFYYREYGDIADKILSAGEETQAASSSSPDNRVAPVKLETLAEYIFNNFKEERSSDDYESFQYKFTAPSTKKGNEVDFCCLPYTYIKEDIKMTGELYVAARGMAYYVIAVDGTNSAFVKYNNVVENMMYNLVFSVFDY